MATDDELLRQWAEQNGADYNLLVGAQNGNTGTSTSTGNTGSTGSTNSNDLYSEYGWDSNNLPGTSIPTGSTTTTPTTTTTTGTSTTSGGTSVQDYINYYTSRGMTTPDMDYNTWVNWMQGGGSSTTPTTGGGTTTGGTTGGTTTGGTTTGGTTTPTTGGTTTGGTTGTTTGGTTPTTGGTTATQGTSVQDYINYYTSRGMTTPDMSYEQWVTWMQNGGTTTPTGGNTGSTTGGTTGGQTGTGTTGGTGATGGQTQGTSVQDYINYWTSRGVTTPPMSYDEWVTFITNGGGTTTGGGTTGGTTGGNLPGGNATHNYPTVDMDNRQRISDMYDAQIEAQRAALQEQGDQALSDAQANRDKIASLYNKQRNAASVDWERQRRNFLEGAATSGINTGAGSQAELSMMSMYQRAQNDLGAAQAQAEAEADRNIADIKRSTQASINEAIAKNDYQKAAALLDEYNAEYNRAVERAEALGQYGDFSGYAALYGDAAAAQMRYTWIMNNPEIALATGAITQQQYAALTLYSKYPALALNGGGGYYSGSSDGGGTTDSPGSGQQSLADLANEARAAGATESEILQALEDIYADGNYGPG